jgi:dTDP-4-amino-4,6-dideoxygalactose transaminase
MRVEPQLGVTEPVILYDYPASQSALARIRPGDFPVAEDIGDSTVSLPLYPRMLEEHVTTVVETLRRMLRDGEV